MGYSIRLAIPNHLVSIGCKNRFSDPDVAVRLDTLQENIASRTKTGPKCWHELCFGSWQGIEINYGLYMSWQDQDAQNVLGHLAQQMSQSKCQSWKLKAHSQKKQKSRDFEMLLYSISLKVFFKNTFWNYYSKLLNWRANPHM